MGELLDRLSIARRSVGSTPGSAPIRRSDGAMQIAWQAMFSSFPLILGLLGIFGLFSA